MTPTAPAAPSAARLRELAPFLERWLATQVECRRVPGAQLAIRLGDELVASAAVGVADEGTGEPLTTSHVFRVASHSKTFTAVAVLQLVEAGRLRLDDTVGARLPDYAGTPLADVTVRELLSHTGGVIRDGVDSDFWQLDQDFPDADALLATVRDHGAKFAPQQHFAYSNIGYGVLGRIVEELTATPFDRHVADAILRPLGLTATAAEPGPDTAPLARGHARPFGPRRERVTIDAIGTGALAAATGFASTAEELSAFYAALRLRGEGGEATAGTGADRDRTAMEATVRLLSDRSLRLMQRREATFTRHGTRASYGLGLIHTEVGERELVGHSGGFPGHITRTLLDPTAGLVVCVLTNAIDGPAESLATGVVRLIDLLTQDDGKDDGRADAAADLPGGLTPADLDRFTGRFHSLWGTVDVIRTGARLVALDPEAPNPADSADVLEVVDGSTLREETRDGFDSPGEAVPYTFDADGRPTSLRRSGESHWTEDVYRQRRGTGWLRR